MTMKDAAANMGTVNLRMNVSALSPYIKTLKSSDDPYTRDRAIGKIAIELGIGIGRSIGAFVPEVGVVFETIKLIKDLVDTFSEQPDPMTQDDKSLALMDRAFSSDNLSKANSRLQSLQRVISRLVDMVYQSIPDKKRSMYAELVKMASADDEKKAEVEQKVKSYC